MLDPKSWVNPYNPLLCYGNLQRFEEYLPNRYTERLDWVKELEEASECMAVVRIRGNVGTKPELADIFHQLHLNRKNHATLLSASPSNKGTLQKVKDYATFGEVTKETIELLLRERGMLQGNKKLTDEYSKSYLECASLSDLAEDMCEGRANLWHLRGVKPIFRLRPPRKGFKGSTKKPYPEGEVGYRGKAINSLLSKMV